ncbi:uncharacterized protein LOC133184829 [Saccostrea echinata]|uniref:uncharacterized protein LOC133184829 n=1 Tax=Saccostrea echinata TaxID=191078 RepID=UPI002A83AB1E|nr:uncharacterized protein LOC133184829 [Saccostrea echinata]
MINDTRQYDIVLIKVTVFNNITNASLTFNACKKETGNSDRTLSIDCYKVETNAYFYQRWCRNSSDCLQNQECLRYADLGVCSATCTNTFSNVNKRKRENEFEGFDIGYVVGAAIGGLVTGFVICVVIVFIFKRNRTIGKGQSSVAHLLRR